MDFGKFKVEGHQRLTTPLNTFAFTLVALVCLLLGEFSRQGQAKRIILASIIFFTLWITNLGIVSFSAKNLHIIPLIYISVIGPILIMLILLNITSRVKIRDK
jgi:lipopolysaccharide export system permease protein